MPLSVCLILKSSSIPKGQIGQETNEEFRSLPQMFSRDFGTLNENLFISPVNVQIPDKKEQTYK